MPHPSAPGAPAGAAALRAPTRRAPTLDAPSPPEAVLREMVRALGPAPPPAYVAGQRGVFVTAAPEGMACLVAVTADGREVARALVRREAYTGALRVVLEHTLDLADPPQPARERERHLTLFQGADERRS